MLKEFKIHIRENFPFLLESRLIVAISGGIDSVVLAYLCKDVSLDIALAHCNFNLRGKESDEDQRFVEALGLKLGIETFVQEFDTKNYAKEHKLSTQMAARDLRYNWFDDLCERLNFDYILTAHHADDNLETFLINLSRGSGLDGLTGIPEIKGNIVRPLLQFARQDIEDFTQEFKIRWREDKSNASTKYLRNKLRHEVIPILKGINPQMLKNFTETLDHLKGAKQIVEDRIDEVSDKVIEVKSNGVYLNIDVIKSQNNPKAYLYELLKDYGFKEWNDVVGLLDTQSGTQVFSKGWRLLKDRNHLILSELLEKEEFEALIDKDKNRVSLPNGTMKISSVNVIDKLSNQTIYVDLDKLKFPLTVRKKREGDVFYPIGMKGKKKVSKYFKDEKFSLIDKENALLMCSGDDIVWVIGYRADNRYKVTETTENILKISFE
ncbi:tRNA lysidine(34) synthetase TilS [Flavobacteriaceae sp. LMIT009]